MTLVDELHGVVERAVRRSVVLGSCLVLEKNLDKDGYARIMLLRPRRRTIRLSRAVLALKEQIDLDDLSWVARHECDNPPCINPLHLLSGTLSENQQDMIERGRRYTNTHCANGHERTQENTRITPSSHKQCRACQAACHRRYRTLGGR